MLELENVSRPTGIVSLHHAEKMLSNMRKKAFTLTKVVMEKDRDTTKCYDSIN